MWFRIVLTSVLLKMSVAMGLGGTLIHVPTQTNVLRLNSSHCAQYACTSDRLDSLASIHAKNPETSSWVRSGFRTAAPISRYAAPDHDQCSAAVAPAVPLTTGQHNLDPTDDTNPVMYPGFQSDNPTIFSESACALAKATLSV